MTQSSASSSGLALGLWRKTRRIFILVIGVTVILVGVVLIVTPGPAFLVIPAGFAILATEFVWARRLLQRFKESAVRASNVARGKDGEAAREPEGFFARTWCRTRHTVTAALAPFRKGYVEDTSSPRDLAKPGS